MMKPNILRKPKNRNSIRPYRASSGNYVQQGILVGFLAISVAGISMASTRYSKDNIPLNPKNIDEAELVMEQSYRLEEGVRTAKASFFIDQGGQLRGWVKRDYFNGFKDTVTCTGEIGPKSKYLVTCSQ